LDRLTAGRDPAQVTLPDTPKKDAPTHDSTHALYRKAGGQPTRWFIQTWYPHPKQMGPETAFTSMTGLVNAVIQKVRGNP
jgi:hypothetical protein